MIRKSLRSTLMLGTALINAVALAAPAEAIARPASNRSSLSPVVPQPQLPKVAALPTVKRPVLQRLDSDIARVSKEGLRDVRLGLATWYGKVLAGHRTASGEVFDCTQLTGASNTLPLGTRVKVTNLHNGRSVVVRINDRGILSPGRIIDLSSAAAEKIGMLRSGVGRVQLDVVPAGA